MGKFDEAAEQQIELNVRFHRYKTRALEHNLNIPDEHIARLVVIKEALNQISDLMGIDLNYDKAELVMIEDLKLIYELERK